MSQVEEIFRNQVVSEAEKELREERFREAVEAHKVKLREKRSLWDRVFPWRIVVVKKGVNKK